MLYSKFAQAEKIKAKDEETIYRTLTDLLAGKKFTGNDEALLKEIIATNKELENIII
ncbi:MAG: hypothetical protein H7Y04_04400 [Verrucomicrobia bacterium]|nr:hypothetical protein [Cytophagales bacterium]